MFERLKSWIGLDEPAAVIATAGAAAPADQAVPLPDTLAQAGQPVLVHREVLDDELGVRGIEFFVRAELAAPDPARQRELRFAADRLLLDHLGALRQRPLRERSVWIPLAETSLLRAELDQLPPKALILLEPERPEHPASPDVRAAVSALQARGNQVWLDDCLATRWLDSLADHATGATLRMAMRLSTESSDALRHTREAHRQLRLGAWDIGSFDDYELARKLGCKRFSGNFITQHDDWRGNTLSPSLRNIASLTNRVREEVNFRAIADVLKQDSAMAYRLLRYVNHAARGQRIASIEQCLLILGQEQLDRWLTLVLLSGGSMGDTALTELALIRARFLEQLGARNLPEDDCTALFALGLFSMLDIALQVPLATAIEPLRLAPALSEALLHRSGPYGTHLALADACSRGVAREIRQHAAALSLSTDELNLLQIEAIDWVAALAAHPVGP